MNTYNDNLRNSVVSSLSAIESDIQKTKAKMDAAMFSLYYAEGAKITALDKYNKEQEKYSTQSNIKIEAVNNENIATNLLATATQENAQVAQSISDTAIAAANAQVAANAITKLASDVGSMLSIVTAADFDTEIYNQTQYANQIMNSTAYSGEVASQIGMEAASLTAKVSASTVEQQATTTQTSVSDLLAQLSSNLEATNAKMLADGKALDAASRAERKAEGALEDVNSEYHSIIKAFDENRKALNLDLHVDTSTSANKKITKPKENYGKCYEFGNILFDGVEQTVKGNIMDSFCNPVKGANVEFDSSGISVITDENGNFELGVMENSVSMKISKKDFGSFECEVYFDNVEIMIFSEKMILSKDLNDHQFEVSFDAYKSPFPYPKTPSIPTVPPSTVSAESQSVNRSPISGTGYPVDGYYIFLVENSKKSTFSASVAESLIDKGSKSEKFIHLDPVSCIEKLKKGKREISRIYDQSKTKDIDGNKMEKGKEYVVFVMAVLTSKYKKLVNNFEDYLSAPSASFMLTNNLTAVNPSKFKFSDQVFSFEPTTNSKVEYRCMFLPKTETATNGLLTVSDLSAIEFAIQTDKAIASLYDPIIAQIKSDIGSLLSYKNLFDNDVKVIEYRSNIAKEDNIIATKQSALKTELSASDRKKAEKAIEKSNDKIKSLNEKLEKVKESYPELIALENYEKNLEGLINAKNIGLEDITIKNTSTIDFFFNTLLAENVTSANYYVAELSDDLSGKFEYKISPETTDNFGNRIIQGEEYVPVVLTYTLASAEQKIQYTNALSDFQKTEAYVLIPIVKTE